jgi:group I intron endonuclease
MYTIYQLTNNVNEKIYIGVTNNFEKRMREHSYASNNCVISRAIRKYGWENFTARTLYTTDNKDQAYNEIEPKYILESKSNDPTFGYNSTAGGEGSVGYKHSPETRERMRQRKLGRTLSSEHRKNISDSNRGQKRTEESRKKMSNAMKGNKNFLGKSFSEETLKLLSEKKAKDWLVMTPDGKIIEVHNMLRFCEENGLTHSAMSRVMNGKIPHHKKYRKPPE